MLWWFAEQALQALPPPEDGILYLVADSTLKGQRGSKHPVAHKTRLSQYHPYIFGFRIVLLMAHWDGYRIPVDCSLMRRKADPDYHNENALFREMLPEFRRPTWCQEVVVTADVAYASWAHLATVQELGYWYVMALPRVWKFAHSKAVKDSVRGESFVACGGLIDGKPCTALMRSLGPIPEGWWQTAPEHCLPQYGTKPTVLDQRNPSDFHMLALSL